MTTKHKTKRVQEKSLTAAQAKLLAFYYDAKVVTEPGAGREFDRALRFKAELRMDIGDDRHASGVEVLAYGFGATREEAEADLWKKGVKMDTQLRRAQRKLRDSTREQMHRIYSIKWNLERYLDDVENSIETGMRDKLDAWRKARKVTP